MSIPIQLNQHQLEALANGVDALLFVVEKKEHLNNIMKNVNTDGNKYLDMFFEEYSPLQPNQEYYVQEDFIDNIGNFENYCWYKASTFDIPFNKNINWQPASQMTYEQSRYKFTVKCVEVKRVQELEASEILQLENSSKMHKSNPYCFYAVIKIGG